MLHARFRLATSNGRTVPWSPEAESAEALRRLGDLRATHGTLPANFAGGVQGAARCESRGAGRGTPMDVLRTFSGVGRRLLDVAII